MCVCVLVVAVGIVDVTVVRGFCCYSVSCSHCNSFCSLWRLIVVQGCGLVLLVPILAKAFTPVIFLNFV